MKAANLLCEYVSNPVGIDVEKPRFTWKFSAEGKNNYQSAYQIIVSDAKELIEKSEGNIWDTGKVISDQSVNIDFSGKSLESNKKYYWKVRIWNKEDEVSEYSRTAFFEMGLLKHEDWKADWICSQEPGQGPLFRKEFKTDKDLKEAKVYVSGLGYYELQINGKKIGDEVLNPGQTDYNKTILYSATNVSDIINKGRNVIGVILGNGRFSPQKEGGHSSRKFNNRPVLILQLNLIYQDGSKEIICSDQSWKTTAGPIKANDIYDGETYDARLEKFGWNQIDYDDSDWKKVKVISDFLTEEAELISQAVYPPIKVNKTLQPKKINSPEPGVFILDFGQNFTGWIKIKGRGDRGEKLKIRYAEMLNEDGSLNTIPNRSAEAEDVYIFKGSGEEVYEPRFTYHGFRYVEITGYPGTPNLDDIEGKFVHTNVNSTGSFYCSNQLINKIHENILWGQKSNLMSIPTDCSQRDERMGWLGDAQLVTEEAAFNFEMAGFFRKYLKDIRDSQKEDGSIPDVVPTYWVLYPADPAWGTACIVMPWYAYLHYNDKRILEENYEMMKKYLDYHDQISDNGILKNGKYGDWCPPWHVNSVDTSLELVSTWYFYHDTLHLMKIAGILGYEEDKKMYKERTENLKEIFNKEFFEEGSYEFKQDEWYYNSMIPEGIEGEELEKRKRRMKNTFAVESQTSNVLPLYLNMVPEGAKAEVIDTLMHDIKVIHNNHLNTGIVGTRYMFDVLSENGYDEVAYKLVTQTTYPSWGYMIKEGATTLWERWEYLADEGMNSHNHIMLGSVDTWFYKALAGINLDQKSPGFKDFIIKPKVVEKIDHVSASLDTVRGMISSNWYKTKDLFKFELKIPVNTAAEVYIPKLNFDKLLITETGNKIWNNSKFTAAEGIISAREESDYVVLKLTSGKYSFRTEEA
ncbi:MAG: family 78 glycoside hydrolase catalytic domain [bacterium]